ncbi:sensor histidine kinase [Rhizocola hellebori]|uniref:sensor histidine kinase n=1 Tax=Rhizocola hellebori TaxID=1392758 RepID=UPI001941A61C|nr:sensor histidine kinase [Rhizocola hellebori]
MDSSRPVPWVSPVLYAAVVIAGLYAGLSGLGDTRLVLFLAGMAALFALEWVRHKLLGIAAKTAMFAMVAFADGSGLAKALFVLVPFTAYFAFGRAVSIALGVACVAALAVVYELTVPGWRSDLERLSDLLMFGLGLVLAIAMAAVAVEETRGRVRLQESHRQIAELSAAAERHRVARDLHDDLGHHLTAVVVLLEKADAFRERDPAQARLAVDDAARSARRALQDVRESVRALRGEAEPFLLEAALQELVGTTVPIQVTGSQAGYGDTALRALYRAAQEGITNARRHARATEIRVEVELGQQRARMLVTDNGCGFEPGREGFGLASMRERVEQAGGQVMVQSGQSLGTQLRVQVPRAMS